MNISFNIDYLMSSLPLMGKGMLGIFAVTLVIVLIVALLNKVSK